MDSLEMRLDTMANKLASTQYTRSMLLAGLAQLFPSGTGRAPEDHEPRAWLNLVVIDLPTGQVAFNYHDTHAHLFAGLPAYVKPIESVSGNVLYERVLRLEPMGP